MNGFHIETAPGAKQKYWKLTRQFAHLFLKNKHDWKYN